PATPSPSARSSTARAPGDAGDDEAGAARRSRPRPITLHSRSVAFEAGVRLAFLEDQRRDGTHDGADESPYAEAYDDAEWAAEHLGHLHRRLDLLLTHPLPLQLP